uniref:Protein phosphatase type 1 regulator-like protein n=1 Tax=Trypanosoma congolense (strain IL3000) TaxID=1068625 RepID=G0UMD6_TRYCI|nr:putative protein phosphatase 1, regulatory subunit [Trypanosoma congolense IL3000]
MPQRGEPVAESGEKENKNQEPKVDIETVSPAQSTLCNNVDDESEGDDTLSKGGREEGTRPDISESILRIDAKSKVIEINNIRLFSLSDIELDRFTECTSLSLRKNLIHDLVPFPEHLAGRLEELDFFDNKIRKIHDFFQTVSVPGDVSTKRSLPGAFKCLTKLDLSYNQIREISGLEPIAHCLRELYLVENKIKEISNLESLTNLELLELGGNRLRTIGPGLHKLSSLKQLWLGKNKISSIGDSLQGLSSLEILSLQANRITSIEENNFMGEVSNPNLREVYLSENGITSIKNVGRLSSIKIIDFSFNPITSINGDEINPEKMPLLEEFWLTDGKIGDWEEVGKLSGFTNSLRTVYLERNPIEDDKRYRDKVYMYLPFLVQIDSWPIVNKGNLEADRRRRA